MASPPYSSAQVFDVVWRELAEVIGTTATAMLFRRAAKTAAAGAHDIRLTIVRAGFEHRYSVPEDWNQVGGSSRAEIEKIFRELRPLLIELTGPVLIRRLATNPITDVARIFAMEDQP